MQALGMLGLTLINFPEDCRDLKSSFKQLRWYITKYDKYKFEPAYDYKEVQHPFSFFKGTLLKHFANSETSSNPELAEKIFKSDITLAKTSFGKKILDFLGVKQVGWVKTKILAVNSTKEIPRFVKAPIYDGNYFGKLTAHAMERSTIWGIGAMTLLELPQIIGAINHYNGIDEKTKNGAKQIIKSGINIAAITTGIGYIGAICAKHGPVGSLIGMGAGAVLGGYGSKQIQKLID